MDYDDEKHIPHGAMLAYERDCKFIDEMPLDLRQAADEIAILVYSTNRTPTRTARVIGYLALLEACLEGRASRSDVEAFMERRQAELAGGPAEPVRALLIAAQTAMSASADSTDEISHAERVNAAETFARMTQDERALYAEPPDLAPGESWTGY